MVFLLTMLLGRAWGHSLVVSMLVKVISFPVQEGPRDIVDAWATSGEYFRMSHILSLLTLQ